MESTEAFDHLTHMDHARRHGSFAQRAAVVVAVLAALLAISTLMAEREAEHTVLAQAQASDAYNEYEANSLKVHSNQDTASMLRILAANTPQAARADAEAARLERAVVEKYDPNKVTLLAKAQRLEAARDEAEHRHKVLQLAQGAFQIGIVLTSVALLSQTIVLVLLGGGLGLIGIMLLVVDVTPLGERILS